MNKRDVSRRILFLDTSFFIHFDDKYFRTKGVVHSGVKVPKSPPAIHKFKSQQNGELQAEADSKEKQAITEGQIQKLLQTTSSLQQLPAFSSQASTLATSCRLHLPPALLFLLPASTFFPLGFFSSIAEDARHGEQQGVGG